MGKIIDAFKKLGKNIIESADAANPEYKLAEKPVSKPVETKEEAEQKKYVPGELLEDLTGDDEDTLEY